MLPFKLLSLASYAADRYDNLTDCRILLISICRDGIEVQDNSPVIAAIIVLMNTTTMMTTRPPK